MTLPQPADNRIIVKRICARIQIGISSMGTASHLYCSIRVDADDADHEIFSENWESDGTKLKAVDIHAGYKPDVFNLITDGQPHTLYFLFWADTIDQVTIDTCQLWEGIGSCSSSTFGEPVLELNHTGFLSITSYIHQLGTGVVTGRITWKDDPVALIKLLLLGYIDFM